MSDGAVQAGVEIPALIARAIYDIGYPAQTIYSVLSSMHISTWSRMASIYHRATAFGIGRPAVADIVRSSVNLGFARYREASQVYLLTAQGEALRECISVHVPPLVTTAEHPAAAEPKPPKPEKPAKLTPRPDVVVRTEVSVSLPVEQVALWAVNMHPSLEDYRQTLRGALNEGTVGITMRLAAGNRIELRLLQSDTPRE